MIEDIEAEIEAAKAEADHSRLVAKRTMLGLALLSILLLGVVVVAIFFAADNARLARENAAFGTEQQVEKKDLAQDAQKALCGTKDAEIFDRDLCAKLAEAAQQPIEVPAELPETVEVAPSQEELVAAFREYCAAGNCRGADGAPPTADDIAAAFVAFCSDGRCTGPAGADGEDGAKGVDAVALSPQYEMVLAAVTEYCSPGVCVGPAGRDGVDGQDVTQDMVLAAVQTVCANGACRGPEGPPGADSTVPGPQGATGPLGPPGPAGPAGRGISDAYCWDNGRWTITYTDGSTSDGGVCRATITEGTL